MSAINSVRAGSREWFSATLHVRSVQQGFGITSREKGINAKLHLPRDYSAECGSCRRLKHEYFSTPS